MTPQKAAEHRKCFRCHNPGHLARDCTKKSSTMRESHHSRESARQVTSQQVHGPDAQQAALLDVLFSSDEENVAVSTVRIKDGGSQPRCARVSIQGVPVYGILDSGADITIMGGQLFQRVATVARLKKRDLKKPDKTPRNYDQTPFSLDGCMELDVAFGEKTLRTPVYIKVNAHEQLLLSEGVCRQLGLIQYHPDVRPWRRRGKQNGGATSDRSGKWNKPTRKALVPTVSVRLVQSVRIPPNHCAVVPVQVTGKELVGPIHSSACSVESMLLETGDTIHVEREYGLKLPSSLIAVAADQSAQVVVVNTSGFTQHVPRGVEIGHGARAVVLSGETLLYTRANCMNARGVRMCKLTPNQMTR